MLIGIFVPQASHAATDDCLAAPKGAAPNGQHWYYRLERATQRKCWYLHETIAKPAAHVPGPTARSNSSARPAAPVETGRSEERAAPPSGTSGIESNTPRTDNATGSIAAPASSTTNPAPPLQPASEPAQGAATIWSAPPQSASAGGQDAPGAPSDNPPAGVANPTDVGDTTMEDAIAQSDQTPMTAAAPENPSTHSVAQDLLIIALAALMAGAVSVAIAVIRRRKPVTAKLADVIELPAGLIDTALAKFAVLRRRKRTKAKPVQFVSGIDESRHDRENAWRPRSPVRKDGSPQPAQTSLVPEQITMARPFVAPRQQARVNLDRRSRVE